MDGAMTSGTMRRREQVLQTIETTGVVAVIRLTDASLMQDVVAALRAGGVRAIEITMTVPNAVASIAQIASSIDGDCIIGAGTVLDADTADRVISAGAQFVVAPVFDRGVVDLCRRRDVAAMPGCFSPTEIVSAWNAGADVVKVFPATVLGPGYFKDLRGPLPHVRLMPTGGVTVENAADWMRAGAFAIGVGTALVSPAAVADRRFDEITVRAKQFVGAVQGAR
jgi:2-dehydro-3-deoxyphosphogluconate aldolase/(4S)-4-hydroxy-2-oxoglutarate aldolase